MKKIVYISILLQALLTVNAEVVFDTISIREVSITSQTALENRGINVMVIDTAIIHEQLTGSLSDLLASNTAVFMKTYGQGALSTISFRGTSATHTKVSWNGIPLNNPMLGQVDFSLVPVNFADRITLMQGGSSLQDGPGALGGTIKLESIPEWSNPDNLEIVQGIGSFGTYKSLANLQIGKQKVLIRIKLFHEQSENDFTFKNTENGLWNYQVQQNADYRKSGLLGELFLKSNENNIFSVHTWIQNSDRNLPAIMSYEGTGRVETQSDDQIRISAMWKNYGNRHRSEALVGYTSSGIDYYLANQTGMGMFVNYNSISNVYSVIADYKFTLSISPKMALKTQYNFTRSKAGITEVETFNGYSAERQEIGGGISLHREVGKNAALFGLLRAEISDKNLSPLMPSLGMEASVPSLKLKFVANLTRNYNLPSLNDLYWVPGGNPLLKPEEGITGDISATYKLTNNSSSLVTMTASGYMSVINDWILWRPGEYSYWTAENIASVFARGVEYAVNGSYNAGSLSIKLFGTWSYTRTTNRAPLSAMDGSVDQQLIYIPLHKANATVKTEYHGFHLVTAAGYVGERFTTSSNEITRHTLPGFMLFDLRLGKDLKFRRCKTGIQFKINNLFNTEYKAILSRPMPGRSWEMVLMLKL